MKIQYFFILIGISFFFNNCEVEKPRCNDGFQNGDETEIDCGGSCGDCYTCYDGIFNNEETDTDCGGPCTPCFNEWEIVNPSASQNVYTWDVAPNGFMLIASRTSFIRKSNDGGLTWTDITMPNTWQYMERVFAVNDQVWYVQVNNSGLQSTRDGGQTWNTTSFILYDMDFLDENHGIMHIFDWNNPLSIVYTTNDGGENWVYQLSSNDVVGNIDKVIRSSEDNFHVITSYKIYQGSHSTNTLNSRNLPQNVFDDAKNMAFKGQNAYALLRTYPMSIIKSEDGGMNWTLTNDSLGISQGDVTSVNIYKNNLVINTGNSIYANKADHPDYQRYTIGVYSTDGGATIEPLGLVNKDGIRGGGKCHLVQDDCLCLGAGIIKLHLPNL